ncbi:hypothetical protein GE21DRAFT_1982 [Neurospora crassa]|uniref:Uncharacterized protein n=1 Tax=Neurospora crassa (strain ATCC 24698 / 74-OR23-1A / CBS 708.71 / DSM 1257 / FGSC 987) TaxID=367110 RepID=Q7SEE5_NEUCR|nr:hypothetical protein NCU00733 [Neurospora crassa OR74A]EAA35150.1 hypothetical protein NCU00733 [Neurospora crassa OR74A]KHE89713.1 hypothetical protein GE21DRAFT_1982 [Neurospora crassa]|eukprot:XP_964386.1 hypothetical protein NCU00733 [Neurospora crassa OR74A]
MSSFPIHWAATPARMKAAPPNIRPKIPAQNTATLKRNRFNIIPDTKTRRDSLPHPQNGLLPRLPHLDASSLSTTRLHPSFLFLSSMSAIDPVCSISAITSSSTLNKHQLTQLLSTPGGTGDIQREGIKANKALPPFTVLMLQYQALSASNKTVRMKNRVRESKHNDDRVSGNDKGDGDEECADKNNREEDSREIED